MKSEPLVYFSCGFDLLSTCCESKQVICAKQGELDDRLLFEEVLILAE